MIHLRQEGALHDPDMHTRCGMVVPYDETTGETHRSTCPHCAEIEITNCQRVIGKYRQRIAMLEGIRDRAHG